MRDHQVLIPVSRGYPCLRGRLLTCYSPVRHSVTEVTPFDLHVLSTPPAFVLSQNQTLHNIYFRNCWTNELLSSSVPCNHRSETPQGFISAQATARVTTFSFPLFILSGAPPGRLLSQRNRFSAAPGASESHTWKIASPGQTASGLAFLSSCPVAGRGRSLPESSFRVKRIFGFLCIIFPHLP